MSGGKRVWINECLVRAVALYLAQSSERRYGTLFSDEADGSLDPEHKRMFGVMKREVLRLGGYGREFFISQTPELVGMADAVIDLDAYAGRQSVQERPPGDCHDRRQKDSAAVKQQGLSNVRSGREDGEAVNDRCLAVKLQPDDAGLRCRFEDRRQVGFRRHPWLRSPHSRRSSQA